MEQSVENDAPLIRWAEVSPEFGSAMPFGSCNAVIEEDEHGGIVCGFPRREDGSCWDGHPAMPTVERHLRALPPADGGGHHPRCTGQHETIMGETACVIWPEPSCPDCGHADSLHYALGHVGCHDLRCRCTRVIPPGERNDQ